MRTRILFYFIGSLLCFSSVANAAEYYVKVTATGNGNGTSWDNALSSETFITKLASDIADGDVIYMAGGTYYPSPATTPFFVRIDKAITIIGGFAPDITGDAKEIAHPTETPTILSGDVNKNETGDAGDCSVLYIDGDVTLKGITVTGGYSTTANRPGIHVMNGNVNLHYCIIDGNTTTTATPANDAGGAGLFLANAPVVHAYKTIISNNTANNRGGGIRIQGAGSQLILESCLVTGNNISGQYGGGIQVSSSNAATKLFCINTTVANNTAGEHGAGINTPCTTYLISSTVLNNKASGQGQDIRTDGTGMYVINSIVTGENSGAPHIYLQGSSKKITSEGFNIFGNVGQSADNSELALQASDATAYYHDVFGNNVLADNDGYPQTVALIAQRNGATVDQLNGFKTSHQITDGDITKDQRGFARNATGAVSIGAYEQDASEGTGVQTVSFDQYIVYPTVVSESVTVAGAKGAPIAIISVSGVPLHAINKAKDVESISLANYPKGVYFVTVNGKTTKIIK
jgi:hypothetical protein